MARRMCMSILERLRAQALSHSLFPPGTLQAAFERLAFVQADPIRSPARAQDLILRHRVARYRAGDLERLYPSLDVEEDVLYAYGFLSRTAWQLLHPRKRTAFPALQKEVLRIVAGLGETHPRDLEEHLGRKRVVNAWGGYSKASTRALEDLHHRGLLRVSRRENGIRVYTLAPRATESLPSPERLRNLVLVVGNILAPVPESGLRSTMARFRYLGNARAAIADLLRQGELQEGTADGVTYLWPGGSDEGEQSSRVVRFLAPFDPLVWDRRRFEHFWQWPYRFEAYTPVAKRVRGYYAMPLLWGDRIIGWANARMAGLRLDVELGFIDKRPRERCFSAELDAEVGRMEEFLGLDQGCSKKSSPRSCASSGSVPIPELR